MIRVTLPVISRQQLILANFCTCNGKERAANQSTLFNDITRTGIHGMQFNFWQEWSLSRLCKLNLIAFLLHRLYNSSCQGNHLGQRWQPQRTCMVSWLESSGVHMSQYCPSHTPASHKASPACKGAFLWLPDKLVVTYWLWPICMVSAHTYQCPCVISNTVLALPQVHSICSHAYSVKNRQWGTATSRALGRAVWGWVCCSMEGERLWECY